MTLDEPLDYDNWRHVFLEVHELFKEEDFTSVVTELPLGGEGKLFPAYVCPFFVLIYSQDKYYISFTINKYKIETVSYYTHILTLLLYDKLQVWADNWVDIASGLMYFGEHAYAKYEEHDMKSHGVTKCPVCEKIIPESFMDKEKGYCKICEKMVIPNATFH